jgi:hypothetical protein
MLPQGQLFNSSGALVPPSTAQSIGASGIPSMSAQWLVLIQVAECRIREVTCLSMNGTSGSIQSMQIRRLTQDAITVKRLVIEKKRIAFSCG